MGIKTKNHGLGRAIIKDKFKGRNPRTKSYIHTIELNDGLNWNSNNFKSVTEENTLDEFLTSAELAGAEFVAERLNVTLVTENNCLPTKEEMQKTKKCQEDNLQLLKIPRRPLWDKNTSSEELDSMERQTFLEWRRSLAMLSEKEGIILTPYEKNLQFWRQLWRVIEKSDVVVQIVDARNPLFFYCKDLNSYVEEMGKDKVNLLLVNKADFLSYHQRTFWSNYFTSINMKIIFWSATNQVEEISEKPNHSDNSEESGQEVDTEEEIEGDCYEKQSVVLQKDKRCIKKENKNERSRNKNYEVEEESDEESTDYTDCEDDDKDLEDFNIQETCKFNIEKLKKVIKEDGKNENNKESNFFINKADIVTVDELIAVFKSFKNPNQSLLTVGLIGYPNVGKSSTINTLLMKRVALNEQAEKSKMYQTSVSTTPGKTKHFQTFFLDKDLMLCDCPGLVMPMFVNAKAEMITNGILSIDHMNDFVPPISILCQCIPKDVLEAFYSIMLPSPQEGENPDRPPTAYELLSAYARIRGFMTHKGVPDYQRAARLILKDFVHGRLNYCYSPPNVSEEDYKCAPTLAIVNKLKNKMQPDSKLSSLASSTRLQIKSELDEVFFKNMNVGFVIKGDLSSIGLKHLNSAENSGKPSKKHYKSNKREKSRIANAHFDAQ